MKIWLVILAIVAACGTSDRSADGFSGAVVGTAIPAEGTVIVGWIVYAGDDHVYKFGDGSSTGSRYTVALPGPVPAAANNPDGVAFGVVALLTKGAEVPEGPFDGNSLEGMVIGGADGGLVFRAASSTRTGWPEAFPPGEVSCARCVHVASGGHDQLEPIACDQLAIDTSPDAQGCNVF